MKRAVFVFVIILFGYMCQVNEVNAEARDPDLLYRAKCAACHRVYPLRNYTYQKLQAYVAKYGKGLEQEERQRLLEYLKENAKHDPAGGGETGHK